MRVSALKGRRIKSLFLCGILSLGVHALLAQSLAVFFPRPSRDPLQHPIRLKLAALPALTSKPHSDVTQLPNLRPPSAAVAASDPVDLPPNAARDRPFTPQSTAAPSQSSRPRSAFQRHSGPSPTAPSSKAGPRYSQLLALPAGRLSGDPDRRSGVAPTLGQDSQAGALVQRFGVLGAAAVEFTMGELAAGLDIPYEFRAMQEPTKARALLQRTDGEGLFLHSLSGDPYGRAFLYKLVCREKNRRLIQELMQRLSTQSLTVRLAFLPKLAVRDELSAHTSSWELDGTTLTIQQTYYRRVDADSSAIIRVPDKLLEHAQAWDRQTLRHIRESPAFQRSLRSELLR